MPHMLEEEIKKTDLREGEKASPSSPGGGTEIVLDLQVSSGLMAL